MILEARRFRISADDLEQTVLLHLFEIDAPAGAVTEQLSTRLLISEQDGAFFIAASILDEIRDQQGLSSTRGSGGENDRVFEESPAAHLIETGNARTDPHIGGALGELHGTKRKDADPMRTHREWELSLHVRGAAQLENLHGAPPAFSFEHIAQNHHVVGDELFNPIASNRPIFVDALCGHHGGDPDFLETSNQTEDLATDNEHSVVLLKHRGDRIDRHPFRLVFANGVVDPLDQTGQVETSGHILTIGIGRSIKDEQLVLFNHLLQIPTEAGGIAEDIERRLFEGDKDPWFVEVGDAVVQKMKRENRFAGTGGTADQRAATDRKAAMTHIIKTFDPCRKLLNLHLWRTTGAGDLHNDALMAAR